MENLDKHTEHASLIYIYTFQMQFRISILHDFFYIRRIQINFMQRYFNRVI